MTTKEIKLKDYMRDNFCFKTLKRVGFFAGIKFNDYKAQAEMICSHFGLKSVYDYSNIGKGTRVHISYASEFYKKDICPPFVETIGGENKEDCRIINFQPR